MAQERRLPAGMLKSELFTDEIAARIAALQALADRATG
jgi:hypothetical protein